MAGKAAFEEKVSATLDALYDGADLLTGDPTRAEALVISVVVEAARELGSPEDPEDFRRWILGRLVRHYLGYAEAKHDPEASVYAGRADDARGEDGDGARELAATLTRLEATAPERLADAIRGSMRELPLRERAALWLVNVMEFGYAEAAAALGVRLSALRDLLYRARHELQVRLAVRLHGARPAGEAGTRSGGGTA